jgi:two-component system, NarL family, response regulator LiaR
MLGPIRVLVADDHVIIRKGICALLATESGIQVIGEAQNGREAILAAQRLRPDVILMDLVMPCMDELEATRFICANQPEVRILALTSFASDDKAFPVIRAGALGYLLKDSGPAELVQAIQQVHRGEPSLHPTIARKVLRALAEPTESKSQVASLTKRETEVLHAIARGWSNRQIAEGLAISQATVRTHVSNILAKLKLGSRTQAALYALREGLVSLDGAERA